MARVCKRAIEIGKNYAKAWGHLAIAECILHFLYGIQDRDGLSAAERAIALDPRLAEAHIVKARHLNDQGHRAESLEALNGAMQLAPESWEVNHEAALIFYLQQQYADAARCFEKSISLVETDFHSWGMLTSVYEVLSDEEKVLHAARRAVADSERVLAQDPINGAAMAMGATGLAILGERDRFYEWVDRALLVDPCNMIMSYNFACVNTLRLKDYDRATDLIEQRLKDVPRSLLRGALVDPDLEGLRNLPRFQAMIEKTKKRLRMT